MVPLHARSFPGIASTAPAPRLDAVRIAAGAGALALNIAALLLLLVPAGLPDLVPQADTRIRIVPIIDLIKPPTTPAPPQVAEVVPPRNPQAHAPTRPDAIQPAIDPIVVDHGSLPVVPIATAGADATPTGIAPASGPVHGIQLEYADAPSPPYPRNALVAGLHGTVLLRVLVDVDGRPLRVEIERSSGHRQLDDAARRFVLKRWSFRPAMQGGHAVQAIGLVPIDFRLD